MTTSKIKIPNSSRHILTVALEGTAPLVTHRFGEESIKQIEAKQQKKAKEARGARNPEKEYEEAMYRFEDGGYGIPSGAVAECVVRASVDVMPKKKAMLRRNFYVTEDGYDARDRTALLRLTGKPEMRRDVVRLADAKRTADLRYRPAFYPPWNFTASFRYDPKNVSDEQLIHLISLAGESIGLAEGRPEKTLALGGWGRFKIQSAMLTKPGEK